MPVAPAGPEGDQTEERVGERGSRHGSPELSVLNGCKMVVLPPSGSKTPKTDKEEFGHAGPPPT